MTKRPGEEPDPDPADDLGAEPKGVDVEAAWAEIVAHWSEDAARRDEPDGPLVAGEDPERLLDVADVPDPARTRRPADATDGLGTASPAVPREQALGDEITGARTGGEPFEYLDYLEHPDERVTRHRLSPEELAQLADEGWAADAGRSTDDRRSTDDWRRPPSMRPTSHVGGEEARSGSSASLDDDDVEGFVPPEPPPLPRGDMVSRLAWVSALGAPLFLLVAALFWRSAPELIVGVAVAAFVAGFVTLVVRMPDRSDDDDDGAVV